MHLRRIGLALGVLVTVAAAFGAGKGTGTWHYGQWSEMQSFTGSAGDSINYYLFTPKAAGPSKKLPLVVWLHGGVKSNGTGGPNFAQDASSLPVLVNAGFSNRCAEKRAVVATTGRAVSSGSSGSSGIGVSAVSRCRNCN